MTALVLLVAVAAGLGALGRKPGQHTPWNDIRRTLRTRKATCGTLLLGLIAQNLSLGNTTGTFLGHCALLVSILLIPPPLPLAGWSIKTGGQNEDSYINQTPSRASLPKPSSSLIDSHEHVVLTIASGLVLAVISFMYSSVSSSSLSPSHHFIGFSTLSAASAMALVYFSVPAALRSQKHIGLALGCVFAATFGVWEYHSTDFFWIPFPFICVGLAGAVKLDTGSPAASAKHTHGHSHAGHKHLHGHDHNHHLHGNHSRLSTFLIARATPGSIIHSVLIEKDSRRIAYFGV